MELLSLSEGKLMVLLRVINDSDEINHYLKNNNQKNIGIFVKLKSSLHEMGELKSVQELRIENFREEDLSGNVFVNPPASSSSPYPGGFNPWNSIVTEDTSPHVTSECQNPDTAMDPRCQSGPSARNQCDPKEGRSSKDYGAD